MECGGMLHNGVPCCVIEWNVVECDATESFWVVWIRMVPTVSQWNSVELVGVLGNGVESCGMERNGM